MSENDQPREWSDYESEVCSIARTIDVVGERWTILIIRDLFNGLHRFDAMQQHLGVAKDVLAKRLARLELADVVERRPYREEGSRTRFEYHLTQRGRDLQAVTTAMLEWGDKYEAGPEGPPFALRHEGCGAAIHAKLVCESGHEIGAGQRSELVPLAGAVVR